jgi:hypothetical protein
MDHDPFDVSGQEQTAAERDRAAIREATDELNDFIWLMGEKRGRRVIRRLLEHTGVFRSSMTGNSQTFFNEGVRSVGLKLMNLINSSDLDNYVLMLKEAKDNVRRADDRQPNSQ